MCEKARRRHTQHDAQKSENANTHTYMDTHMDTHPEKAVEMPIINQVKVTALMLQSHL